MKKDVVVLSLGGSIIVPDKINEKFIKVFSNVLIKNSADKKFVIVCGGGHTARVAIAKAIEKNKSRREIAQAGINATKKNAKILISYLNGYSNKKVPNSFSELKKMFSKNKIIICGALQHRKKETSDSTAAKVAKLFKTDFINMTNVKGLYTSDPNRFANAKFIKSISWVKFEEKANKLVFKPGQHFVLDQHASTIIRENKITTFIIGPDSKNFDNLINNKNFVGTTIFK